MPFFVLCYQPILSSNWTWRELVRRDFSSEQSQMIRWAAEVAEKAVTDAAAAAAAALPSAASTMRAVELGPTPLALPANADPGREREWKWLYVTL